MNFVYILLSLRDKNIYTGYTKSLDKRIKEHKLGKVKSTASRRPLKLIYYEAYVSKRDAQSREKYLKGGGKAKLDLKRQINNSIKGA